MGFWSWLFGGNSASTASHLPLGGTSAGAQLAAPREDKNAMNQGDYHSGPEGYSANTAYPETQYGSGFDEDAAWHEGEN
jgi:hypothetical protein